MREASTVHLDWPGSSSVKVSHEGGAAVLDVAVENAKETHLVFAVSSLVFALLGLHLVESLHQHGRLLEPGQVIPAAFLALGGLGGFVRNLLRAFARDRLVFDGSHLELIHLRMRPLSPKATRVAKADVKGVRVFENGSRIHKKHRAVIYIETHAGTRLSLGDGLEEGAATELATVLRALLLGA